jgi:hypothetical protein
MPLHAAARRMARPADLLPLHQADVGTDHFEFHADDGSCFFGLGEGSGCPGPSRTSPIAPATSPTSTRYHRAGRRCADKSAAARTADAAHGRSHRGSSSSPRSPRPRSARGSVRRDLRVVAKQSLDSLAETVELRGARLAPVDRRPLAPKRPTDSVAVMAVRLAISRIERPSTSPIRLISAHLRTSSTSFSPLRSVTERGSSRNRTRPTPLKRVRFQPAQVGEYLGGADKKYSHVARLTGHDVQSLMNMAYEAGCFEVS